MERTATDFIEDMLEHGRGWVAILGVARAVRNGKWYDQVKVMLLERGLMPTDPVEVSKQYEAAVKYCASEPPSKYVHVRRGWESKSDENHLIR